MSTVFKSTAFKLLLIASAAALAWPAVAKTDPGAALRTKYNAMDAQLRDNQFKRPLFLDSAVTPARSRGEMYAVVNYPFAVVSAGLSSPDHWCDVMILHINTKYCRSVVAPSGPVLRVNIGKKTPEDLTDAARVEFSFTVGAASSDYLEVLLAANEGPLGTSDYRIQLDAVALPNAKTFLHLTYTYATDFSARLAMQTYLATLGRSKVGFTVVGTLPGGQPAYVGGMRGVVERNTMRYYLAIDAYLESLGGAPAGQLDKRLQGWFAAVERYPLQLHELDLQEYLSMKHAEVLRQQQVN